MVSCNCIFLPYQLLYCLCGPCKMLKASKAATFFLLVVGFIPANCTATTKGAQHATKALSGSTVPNSLAIVANSYILGPGDTIQVEILNIPELSGIFTVGPDGTLYLPRLRSLYVEGLTLDELRLFLEQQYMFYVKSPRVYTRAIGYRPIRVYISGEVRRPGFYTLRGLESFSSDTTAPMNQTSQGLLPNQASPALNKAEPFSNTADTNKQALPTVFDAIRAAQGITPFSDLSNVVVTRKRKISASVGKISTRLNFFSLITTGEESQNIRLFDGDIVNVGLSKVVLQEQLIKAGRSNLSPPFINVFVTGRVNMPGSMTLQQGSSLNQAISVAGGVKLLRGKVEFLRFLSDGKTDRRTFNYSEKAPSDTFSNPILNPGDIIRVNESAFSAGIGALNEVATPLIGIYSIYAITNGAFKK